MKLKDGKGKINKVGHHTLHVCKYKYLKCLGNTQVQRLGCGFITLDCISTSIKVSHCIIEGLWRAWGLETDNTAMKICLKSVNSVLLLLHFCKIFFEYQVLFKSTFETKLQKNRSLGGNNTRWLVSPCLSVVLRQLCKPTGFPGTWFENHHSYEHNPSP